MKKKYSPITKIIQPRVSGILERKRLFKSLDDCRKQPVTWVSGPGGSGKTTLVASYLDARRLPCLWYAVDAGDSDIASFFYYMGLAAKEAAPRYLKPMPLLTPEYLLGIPVFTQRYFEELFRRISECGMRNAEFRKKRSTVRNLKSSSPFIPHSALICDCLGQLSARFAGIPSSRGGEHRTVPCP